MKKLLIYVLTLFLLIGTFPGVTVSAKEINNQDSILRFLENLSVINTDIDDPHLTIPVLCHPVYYT